MIAISYHFQLITQGEDSVFFVGDEVLQILVPQLLPCSAFPRALATPLQLDLLVDLGRSSSRATPRPPGALTRHAGALLKVKVHVKVHVSGIGVGLTLESIDNLPNHIGFSSLKTKKSTCVVYQVRSLKFLQCKFSFCDTIKYVHYCIF